jgi:hypothetical protein
MSALAERMKVAGYEPIGTGGGCEAWSKTASDGSGDYVWICTEDQGLGEQENEDWLVGLYNEEGDKFVNDETKTLTAALAWCERINDPNRWKGVQ